jgi:N-formylglutamate amidohydrolase
MPSPTPPLVVHIPHASIAVPDDCVKDFLLTREELEHELLVMTDHYTDELFALPPEAAATVAFPISRLVLDPERFVDDADEPMAKKGMGVVYNRTSSGSPLRDLSSDQRRDLVARFYEPHHAALTSAVQAALDTHDACLLVDGHSFPARALPFELDQSPERPDICIGTDATHTPEWLRDLAVRTFLQFGWSVAVNRPFAGAIVPMRFYQQDFRVLAVMVEVNRRLYMHEGEGAKLPCFDVAQVRLRGAMMALASAATAGWRREEDGAE